MSDHSVPAEDTVDRILIVTSGSRELRRSLGAVAWSVLEDISLDALWDGCAHVAITNVRRIAEHVGVSKDTAARAVARLAAAGLVVRTPATRDTGGTFAGSGYRLEVEHLDDAIRITALRVRNAGTPTATPSGRHRRKASAPPAQPGQAALFDLDPRVTR